MLDFRIPYRIIFSLMQYYLHKVVIVTIKWICLPSIINRFLNYHQNCYKPGCGMSKSVTTKGGICLFLVSVAEGKSLSTSHMVNQHDSILRDLLSLPVVSCDKATMSSGLSQSHSNTTRSAYKLYLFPEVAVQSSCNISQNWFESVKRANTKCNLLMLKQINKYSIKLSETTFLKIVS